MLHLRDSKRSRQRDDVRMHRALLVDAVKVKCPGVHAVEEGGRAGRHLSIVSKHRGWAAASFAKHRSTQFLRTRRIRTGPGCAERIEQEPLRRLNGIARQFIVACAHNMAR